MSGDGAGDAGFADACGAGDAAFGSVAEALRAGGVFADYLNSAAVAGLDGPGCGEVLVALGEVQGKLAAAQAALLRRFEAAGAHAADGYGSASAWLAARARLTRQDARAAVREMHRLGERPRLDAALAAGEVTRSWALAIAGWTRKLPGEMREETDRILLEAAAAGASLDDLATIAACAIERWRQQQPDPEDPDDGFDDRYVQAGTTFGGAGMIRGNLTPDCAAAVRAVLEALGKKQGPEDDRTEGKRFHDALQLACELLLRAKLVPDRAGADTQVIAHIPLSQLRRLPGAPDLEDAWIRARLGEDGYLTGKDAETAACDAQTVPVVTGTTDPDVIDQMINIARTAAEAGDEGAADGDGRPCGSDAADRAAGEHSRSGALSPQAWRALRYAMARLAIDLVSGPTGIAAVLRRELLDQPYNTPSLPLDIGRSRTIPGHIRRPVLLRDRTCAWPPVRTPRRPLRRPPPPPPARRRPGLSRQLRPACHHDVCVHRQGWQLTLHPDGTTEARSPDGRQILHSHAPPVRDAA
ncbi:MAG TPA: DUF222 domain-containing protein [Trebonia sp.]